MKYLDDDGIWLATLRHCIGGISEPIVDCSYTYHIHLAVYEYSTTILISALNFVASSHCSYTSTSALVTLRRLEHYDIRYKEMAAAKSHRFDHWMWGYWSRLCYRPIFVVKNHRGQAAYGR